MSLSLVHCYESLRASSHHRLITGPGSDAMTKMGDKIESKKIAKAAGVNVIPGFLGEVHNDEEVLKIGNY